MFTYLDKELLKSFIEQFSSNTTLQLSIVEKNTGKLLPHIRFGKLYINRHFESYLLFQHLSSVYRNDLFGLPSLYYETYTLIDYNYYDIAELKLNLLEYIFHKTFDKLQIKQNDVDINIRVLASIGHELGHLHFAHDERLKSYFISMAKDYLEKQIKQTKKLFWRTPKLVAINRIKSAKEWLNNDYYLEEIACDFYGVLVVRNFLMDNNSSPQYINRAIMQCPYSTIAITILNFSLSEKWIKNWKTNISSFTKDINRLLLISDFCIEHSDSKEYDNMLLSVYLWCLRDSVTYNRRNWKSDSLSLLSQGASPKIDIIRKNELMERLIYIEQHSKNIINTLLTLS